LELIKRKKKKAKQNEKAEQKTSAICYDKYHLTGKEQLKYGILYLFILIGICYLFYDTIWISVIAIPFLYPYFQLVQKKEAEKRRQKLKLEFKDALTALTASIHTGYAVENAFREAYAELTMLYDKDALIVREFDYMLRQMRVSRTVEEVVDEFAERSGLEDIQNFAQVFSMANRSNGGLISIMDATADTIGQKIEVEREILTMIQGKKFEQKIMSVVPIGMIAYLRLGNGEFMEVLYNSIAGRAVMTVSLLVYFFALWLAGKIMKIKI